VCADLAAALMPGAFDLVLANIAAPLLVERRHEILALGAPAIVLAGLLATDADTVRAAYEHAGRIEVRQDGEWAALLVEAAGQAGQRSHQPSPPPHVGTGGADDGWGVDE
jgi:ribosomal protein L11 methylase PrmA